jgi:hypothetical protein
MHQAINQFSTFAYATSKPAALYELRSGPIAAAIQFFQGLCAALLAYAGVGNVSGADGPGAPVAADFSTLDGFTQAVLEGRLTGPSQMLTATFLFFLAGGRNARLAGLLTGLALVFAHAQGVTLADGLSFLGEYGARAIAALRVHIANESAWGSMLSDRVLGL